MKRSLLELVKEVQLNGRIFSYDEAATKQGIILSVLDCLGWDPFNINEVYPEYTVGEKKVDYALKHNDNNKVFIEAKKVGEDLEKHQEQLLNYSFQEGVKLAILTNGIAWWFYLPLHEGSWEQRKFYTIEIQDQEAEEIAKKFLDFLSKKNIISGKSVENAERVYTSKQKTDLIKKTLPEAWGKLLNEADESLIELVAETTEKLCGYKPDHIAVEDFLVSYVQATSNTVSRKTKKRFPVTEIPSKKQERYTGKTIVSFNFKGKEYKVEYWIEMLKKICSIILEFHRDKFEQILKLKGRRRPYFTKDKNELRVPSRIETTDIYMETNLSANSIVKITQNLISLFGYDSENLSIKIE